MRISWHEAMIRHFMFDKVLLWKETCNSGNQLSLSSLAHVHTSCYDPSADRDRKKQARSISRLLTCTPTTEPPVVGLWHSLRYILLLSWAVTSSHIIISNSYNSAISYTWPFRILPSQYSSCKKNSSRFSWISCSLTEFEYNFHWASWIHWYKWSKGNVKSVNTRNCGERQQQQAAQKMWNRKCILSLCCLQCHGRCLKSPVLS